jgi:TRAP-type C4-dicarboxylate transport system permease small subunit
MAEGAPLTARPASSARRALDGIAVGLAIFGGLLGCAMAALVTISVTGRYLFNRPVPGDYDIVAILCGCAIFAFLPYCQLQRGNVLVDFFTVRASPRARSILDAIGKLLYLAAAAMFTWRLYYGALEMRQSGEQIAAFSFYRWWTVPFDLLCMAVLIVAIIATLVDDVTATRRGDIAPQPGSTP